MTPAILNQQAGDANAAITKTLAKPGQEGSVTQHMELAPNRSLYYARPITAYPEQNPVLLLATRLVAFNGPDMTKAELLKYLKDARKHGLC